MLGSLLVLGGCLTMMEENPPTPVQVVMASPTPAPTAAGTTYVPQALPGGLLDRLPVMSGICFEAAYDAAGQVFVLRSAEEHIRFYDLADNSGLCRRAVQRYPFDFEQGAVLAGLWSRGLGCTARHEVLDYVRDDAAQEIVLSLRFVTEGDCNYELVRPFWVEIPAAQEYAIRIEVQ